MVISQHNASLAPFIVSGSEPTVSGIGRKNKRLQRKMHYPWYSTYILFSGKLHIEMEVGKDIDVFNKACIVIPPATRYTITLPELSGYLWFDWGIFRSPKSKKLDYLQPQPKDAFGVDWPIEFPETLYEDSCRFGRLITGNWWLDQWGHQAANSYLTQWIITARSYFMEQNETGETKKPTPKFIKLADANLEKIRNSVDWANLLGISTKTLDRKCYKHFNLPSHQVLTQRRVIRAQTLLKNPKYSNQRIASFLGFASGSTFSRWFSKHLGMPPSKWREAG